MHRSILAATDLPPVVPPVVNGLQALLGGLPELVVDAVPPNGVERSPELRRIPDLVNVSNASLVEVLAVPGIDKVADELDRLQLGVHARLGVSGVQQVRAGARGNVYARRRTPLQHGCHSRQKVPGRWVAVGGRALVQQGAIQHGGKALAKTKGTNRGGHRERQNAGKRWEKE